MSSISYFKHAAAEVFPAGRRIFFEGEDGDTMYVVKDGEVDLLVSGVQIATVGQGGILGEMALIDDKPRSATAIARTDCALVPVDKARFLSLIQQTPYFAIEVMKVLAARIRAMNDRLGA